MAAGEPITTKDDLKAWIKAARLSAPGSKTMSRATLGKAIRRSGMTIFHWEMPAYAQLPSREDLESIARACSATLPPIEFALRQGNASIRRHYHAASSPTLVDEILQSGLVLASHAYPAAVRERNASMFVARFGGDAAAVGTLRSIGDQHGMTRERVRQILDKLLAFLGTVKLPTLRFDALHAACAGLRPQPIEEAERELRPLLGEGLTLVGAKAYGAEVLGQRLPFHFVERRGESDLVVPGDRPEWFPTAILHSRRLVFHSGAALSALAWASTLRDFPGLRLDHAEFMALMSQAPGFEWIDEAQGWYWLGYDGSANRLAEWAFEILEAAGRPVDIEEIFAGIARFDRKRESQVGMFAGVLPPISVALRVLSRVPGIGCKQSDDLYLMTGHVPSLPRSAATQQLLDVLRERDGVASRREMRVALQEQQGMNAITFSVQLATSPVLRQVDRGVYAIRGWPLNATRLAQAKMAVGSEAHTRYDAAQDASGSTSWSTTLTAGSLRNRQITLPAHVAARVPAGEYALQPSGAVTVVLGGHPRLKGCVRALLDAGAVVGRGFRVTLEPATMSAQIELLDSAAEAG